VIFVTVGTQGPFDRLVAAVDGWAGAHPQHEVFAQVGPSALRPRHVAAQASISPSECRRRIRDADLVLAHAGMGTVLSVLALGTPLRVIPRRAALGEHRNDHQLATARWLAGIGSVGVAFDEVELERKLDELGRTGGLPPINAYASDDFIAALRTFIDGDARAVTRA